MRLGSTALRRDSPRLLVFVDRGTVDTQALSELKAVTARGFVELKGLIEREAAVLDVEMFTNDWYDGGAVRVIGLVTKWEARSIAFTLREVHGDVAGDGAVSTIEVSVLRNIVGAGEDERTRAEEIDEIRYGEGP